MKYHVSNGNFGIIRDRFGDWIPLLIGCDTYTGEVECFVEGADGRPLIRGDEAVKEIRKYAAPLAFEPLPAGFKKSNLDPTRKAKPL